MSGKESACQYRRRRVPSVSWEDPLEKEMGTHSSILAWKIPWTGEPGGLQSMGSQRVRHDWRHSTHGAVMIKENKLLQMAAASITALRRSPSCFPSHKEVL